MKIKKTVLASLATLSVFTIIGVSSSYNANASDYLSGAPSFLKNKVWKSGYMSFLGKGSDGASKTKSTFMFKNSSFNGINDFITDGHHTINKNYGTHIKYKKLGNNKYKISFLDHLKGYNGSNTNTYTVKVISKNHIKMNAFEDPNHYQSYYTKY